MRNRFMSNAVLVETGFSRLHPRETMNRAIKKHKVPDITSYPLDRLKKEDVPSANRLLTKNNI